MRRTVPIVALDVPHAEPALQLVRTLGDACRFYKVGSELFTAEGPRIVHALRDAGCEVFLDLKFHDIPNTVRAGVRSASRLGARLVTVHASGGRDMIAAAVDGAGEGCSVLAVTVLTSHDAASLGESWGRDVAEVRAEVLRLAALARAAGAPGIVCSGEEAAEVADAHGDGLRMLVPGVRLQGGATHDQVRVVTPAAARDAGASWIILGRAVTASPDPVAAMGEVHRQLGAVAG